MFGMRWDGTVSIGNLISIAVTLVAVVMAVLKFVSNNNLIQAAHTADNLALTNATNNLAAITERMQRALEHQGSQLDTVKATQSADKADLLAHQAKVKEALVAQSAEIGTIVAVHIAKDDERFSALAITLSAIDRNLNQPK